MKRKLPFTLYILFLVLGANFYAQNSTSPKLVYNTIVSKKSNNLKFTRVDLFNTEVESAINDYSSVVSDGLILTLNQNKANTLLNTNPENLELEIPFDGEGNTIILELYQKDVYTPDVIIRTSDGRELTDNVDLGKHYRGIISGDASSLVSISIFDEEVTGFISNESGTYSLGKLQNDTNQHILYKSQDLLQQPIMNCATVDDGKTYDLSDLTYSKSAASSADKCVKVYIESGNSIYNGFGGNETDTINFLSSLFAQSYVLYDNDGIFMQTSELFIWTTPDPYTTSGSGTQLSGFQNNTSSINADIGHLVELQNIGGIAAGFDGICNPEVDNSLCFSGLFNFDDNIINNYNFNIYLITHEMGHLLGSRHTHACVWNGNNTAIDGCADFTEGSCAVPGDPVGGGTIMSYCNQSPVGVNFNNGFHPQPLAVINNSVNDINNCLGSCGFDCTVAEVPTNISAGLITDTFANITWEGLDSATFDLRYRELSTTTWTIITDRIVKNALLENLLKDTEYEVQVRSKCSNGNTSLYSDSFIFRTNLYCNSASLNALGIYHINNVSLNTINNNSTQSTYSDFTNISTPLNQGEIYTVSISLTADSPNYATNYSVWIDYNSNGSFDDPGEQVFSFSGTSSATTVTGQFTVPTGIEPGDTRMRVSLNFDGPPTSCETFGFGEVEDYTINIEELSCTVFEDFESGLPTGWSTVVNTGTCDWVNQSATPTGDLFPTLAMVFDDDACGNGAPASNVSLLSDVYDTTGATFVLIGYDVAFQEVGSGETLTVEVWDGAAWQQIALYTTDLNPDIQNEAGIDATAFANANFQVRWTYDDAGGVFGWHAGVDNFCLSFVLPPPPPCTVFEDFEAGLPAGWSTVVNTGTCDWVNQSATPTGDLFPTLAMVFDDDACGNGAPASNVSLLSVIYDTTGASSILIGYDVAFQEVGSGETLTVEVWDGAAWQQIAFYDTDLTPNIQTEADIDATAFANANFQVRWTYDDGGGWGWHAGVDNFCMNLTFNNWEGTISTDWDTPANWSLGAVPTSVDSAVITDVPNQPLIDDTTIAEVDNLILNSNTTVSVEGVLKVSGDITNDGKMVFKSSELSGSGQLDEFTSTITGSGEVTVERYIPARRAFRFLASPVTTTDFIYENWQESGSTPVSPDGLGTHITGGSITDGFDQSGSNNPSMFTYDISTQNWEALANTNATQLIAGNAYLTMVRGDRTIDLTITDTDLKETTLRATGELFTGPISPTLTAQAGLFSLVGNPYQAIVDINNLDFSNVNENVYWVWDPNLGSRGNYVAVMLPGGLNTTTSTANQFIQPGQSFFVQTIADGPAGLTFNENDKTVSGDATAVFSQDIEASLKLLLYTSAAYNSGERETDGMLINFSENGNNGLNLFDADKLQGPDENLARLHGNALISLEQRAMPANEELLQLSVTGYTAEQYTFVVNASNIDTNFEAYLQDNYTGTLTRLNEGSNAISFSVDANILESIAEDRFSLIFDNTTLAVDDNTFGANFSLYPNPSNNGQFSIRTPNLFGEVRVILVNMLGQKILRETLTIEGNEVNVNAGQLSDGVYIVKLAKDKQTFITKLIVEN